MMMMNDKSEGLTLLFHKLCEVSFLNEASKREDVYTKIRYTKDKRLKVQKFMYEKLFKELRAPWYGGRDNRFSGHTQTLDVYQNIAVTVFQLRLARQFDRADLLEYCTSRWKTLPEILTDSVDLESPRNFLSEPNAILRLVVALSGTGTLQPAPILGYQDETFTANIKFKDLKCLLPEGPLLNTDSLKLKTEALLADHYVQYSSALFEKPPTIGQKMSNKANDLIFSQVIDKGQGRNRFFALQEAGEEPHDKKTRITVFGALSHGYTEDIQVKLGLPELPSSPQQKAFGLSTLSTPESPDDEGFHELSESSLPTSRLSESSQSTAGEDIWKAALALPPCKFYTWEMEGRRDGLTEYPYISEAGPVVFDELYNQVSRQISYMVETHTYYTMVSLKALVSHSLDVLIGVTSLTYPITTDPLGFIINPDVRLSGCSPELIQNVLSKLADIGTDYVRLVRFIDSQSQSGGLVLQAFLGGLRNYLQCYRATVLSVDAHEAQSPFQLGFTFQGLGRQLRFLSEMCMCSKESIPPNSPAQMFPSGVKLLSYLYKLAIGHSSSEHYPILLSLLKHSCTPYIMFIQQWVFQGKCLDLYGEFIIELDDQFLAYRDKHFWSHGFVIAEPDKLESVPMFLSELANDIFVCGKSINLLKLCCPDHFLCDSGILPPKMEVTFSMSKLKAIDQNCCTYVDAMETIAKNVKEQREIKKLAEEQAKEKSLSEERNLAEKAMNELNDMIEKVKEVINAKKKEDLRVLKNQMEDAIKQKQISKEEEMNEDKRFIKEAMNRFDEEDRIRESARQELIDYYQKLTEEMDRREERAQWTIRRHKLNKTRMAFFAREKTELENLIKIKDVSDNFVPSTEGRLKQEKYSTAEGTDSLARLQSKDARHVISSTPSPGLVSLIASGVKTDALVQLQTRKDSGFSPGSKVSGTLISENGDDQDISEGNTLRSVPSLGYDGDDETDASEVSSILSGAAGLPGSRPGRKTWSTSKGFSSDDLKTERSGATSRRTWESSTGEVQLAESPFPHGHPSESSIQFAMYGDKKSDSYTDTFTGNEANSKVSFGHPATPNPSDSSLQSILYPESGDSVRKSQSLVGNVARSSASASEDTTKYDQREGTTTPSDVPEENTPSTKDDPVIRDFLRSLSTDVIMASSIDHPSNSTIQNYMEEDLNELDTRRRNSPLGNPTQLSGITQQMHAAKSQFGHPNDSTAQNLLYSQKETSTTYGTPKSSHGHSADATVLTNKARGRWGHPSDSKVQKLLTDVSILSDNKHDTLGAPHGILYPETTRGTPDLAESTLYPEENISGGKVASTRGHEPAVTITKLMYPREAEKEIEPESAKPLEFEDIWVASQVQTLQDNFDILDKNPTTDLLKRALGAVAMDHDDDDDVDAAQLMSLPVLLRRSVTAPLVAQISLVNSAVVEYFIEDLDLHQHFEVFRKFLFMEDGEFSLSLSDQMFEKLSSGVTPREFCSPNFMNGIVTRALKLSVYANKTGHEQQLSFALKSLPDIFNLNDIGILDFLELRYHVQWPVNIVITENAIIKYNKIFSFMLRLKRVAWVLREIWFHLKHIGFSQRAAGSPQLRQLQLFRHEMLHFLQNIEGYLSNQILNVTWVEFQQELVTNVRNLDDLHHRHTEYLNKAIFRSLLSKKAAPVMKIINDIFSLVLKFRTQLMSYPWQQDDVGSDVIHPRFQVMCATHRAFKEYSGFLFTVVSKLVRRGYQSHLQDFLLRLNFNDFYKMV